MMNKQLQCPAALLLVLLGASLAISPENRILGGEEAEHDATPHAVSLRIDNAHVCGATILSETKILTAAHCLYRDGQAIDPSRISGRVGSSNQFAGGTIVHVASYVVHPDYYKLDNNLAVLTLATSLQWTQRIQPIELLGPEDALPAAGTVIGMSGWGTTVEGSASFKIRQLSMTFATDEACLDAYSDYDASKFFCLAHPLKEGGCNGDGGGGAIYQDKLLGVSNFIVGACGSRYPDVYVLVPGYYAWLQQQLLLIRLDRPITSINSRSIPTCDFTFLFNFDFDISQVLVIFALVATLITLTFAAPGSPQGRHVGGVDATLGQFPHQISLRQSGSHICGGSIISRDFILTAAHCVSTQLDDGSLDITPARVLSIRAGSLDRFSGGVLINVEEVQVHENYTSFWNDVALLQLERPLIFSNQIQAIPLATDETPAGSPVIVSGWGRLVTGGDVPRTMQWNTLSAITKRSCALSIGVYRDNMLCLAHESGNGACNGDSGGPAILNGEIIGIAGFVVGGCGSSSPDGYAKVFYHRDWIIQHANL